MKRKRLRSIPLLLAVTAVVMTAPAFAQARNSDGITWTATAGLGFDSNVYLTPDAPYNDLAVPGNPLVVPNKKSGLFVPLSLGADYTDASGMEFKYRFDGVVYLGKALQNANVYDHNVTAGWTSTPGWLDGGSFYKGFLAGYHKQIYYDRDTGDAKITQASGTNVSNRYTHFDVGGEVKLRQESGDTEYKLNSKLAMLFYNDPIVIAPLDHMLFELDANARFPLGSDSSKLKLGYDFTVRDYTNRSARDLQGVQSKANGLLIYYYHIANVQLLQKFGHFMAIVDYWHTWRIDGALGYNSYSKDRAKLRLRYHPGKNFLLRGSVGYSRTNYPHAFAFNNPAAARKTYKKLDGSLKFEFDHLFSGHGDPALWISGDYVKQDSSDLRYVYKRAQAMIGADWQF